MQHKERISSFHQWPGLLPEKKHKFQYELLKVNFSITSKFITGTFFLFFCCFSFSRCSARVWKVVFTQQFSSGKLSSITKLIWHSFNYKRIPLYEHLLNRPFGASHSCGTKPPCWRAKDAQKASSLKGKIWYYLSFLCIFVLPRC